MTSQGEQDRTQGEQGRTQGEQGRSSIARIDGSSSRREWTRNTARELRRQATPSETALWEQLRGRRFRGHRFRRQQPVGPFVVDFFCSSARLVVEVDGDIHDLHKEYDQERQAWLEGAGYRVVRVTNDLVESNLPGVLHKIKTALQSLAPSTREEST